MIHEFINRIDVVTPEGPGAIWFVTQFGHETSLVFCVIQDNGTLWEWQPRDIRIKDNRTFNRQKQDNGTTSKKNTPTKKIKKRRARQRRPGQ